MATPPLPARARAAAVLPKLPHKTTPQSHDDLPPYGRGVPGFALNSDADWRRHFAHHVTDTPLDMLIDLCAVVFRDSSSVDPRSVTLPELTEAVRRALWAPGMQYSAPQCEAIATALLRDAGLWRPATATACSTHAEQPFQPGRIDVPAHRTAHHHHRRLGRVFTAAMTGQAVAFRGLMNAIGLRSTVVPTPDAAMHVFDSAPGSDVPPVVLLHGMFTTSLSMAPLAILLATHRRVVVPDLPDFDFSFSHSTGGPGSLGWHDYVSVAADLLACYSPTGVDVIGHSYGGWLATHVAHEHPTLVNNLVLVCPGGLTRYRVLQSFKVFATRRHSATAVFSREVPAVIGRPIADLLHSVAFSSSNLELLRSLEFNAYQRRLRCRHRALLLWGSHDTLHVPADDWAAAEHHMMRDLDNGKGYWIQGGGHPLPTDSALTVYDLVCRFLHIDPTRPPAPGAAGARCRAMAAALRVAFRWTQRDVLRMQPSARL